MALPVRAESNLKGSQPNQQIQQHCLGFSELAIPDNESCPACMFERRENPLVSSSIFQELGFPELRPRLRQHCIPTPRMPMPEATMDEYANPQPRQHDIRFPRQILAMQPVTIAVSVQKPAHQHFRFCVLPLDARHHSGPSGRVNDVHFEPFRYSVDS